MKYASKTCCKLTWTEVGLALESELRAILGRSVPCEAWAEDMNYWGGKFPEFISLAELCIILQRVCATKEEWVDALPDEGDTVIHDIGWDVAEKLLQRSLGISWECRHIEEEALWLLGVQDSSAQRAKTVNIGDVEVCFSDLKSKDELFSFFQEGACDHAALMEFCEDYQKRYNDTLCWPYTLAEGKHLGRFLVLVREGVLSLPYDGFDGENYEFFNLEDARLMTSNGLTDLVKEWRLFSDELVWAVSDMAAYLNKKEEEGA